MAQVSKNPLDQKTKSQIFEQLYDLVAKLHGRENITRVLGNLLTKTERMMVAKRIAAIILLEHSWSIRHISKALKMSTSTIVKYKNELEGGNVGLNEIVRLFSAERKTHKIVEHLQSVLAELIDFIPPQKNSMRSRHRIIRS